MAKEAKSGADVLLGILQQMNTKANFPMSVLTDKEGLPIASAFTNGVDPDKHSAVVAFLQKTAVQVSKQLGMDEIDEISFSYVDGQHLICRPFNINTNRLILAFIVTNRDQSYRRITNRVLSEIRNIWN